MVTTKTTYLDQIQKKIKAGRGQGEGVNYIPWIKVHEFPSRGRSSRICGWKTERDHHLFSDLESSYFFVLDWSLLVSDIREQYPLLPIEETLEIANEIGIKHPMDPDKKCPKVITTDFLVSVENSNKARTTKYESDLNSYRNIEKFEIERVYWSRRGIDWGIVTEREIPEVLVKNIRLIHKSFHINLVKQEVLERVRVLNGKLKSGQTVDYFLPDLTV